MKNFTYAFTLLIAFTLVFSSCTEEEPDNGVTISGIPATAKIDAGGKLGPVTGTAEGLDGLVSLAITKDGAPLSTLPLTGTSATFPFEYTAIAADAGKNLVFEFTVTDKDGDVAKATHVLSVGAEPTTIRVTSNITANTTWVTGKTYILGGRITVNPGVKLTIQKGVIVKGEAGTGANATALLIPRGAQIDAQGTATEPIIFTSVADEIAPGQIASPNLEPTQEGLWGGLIILGRAKCSFAGDVAELQIEGIPASDTNGLYGGTNDADNSGILRFVSIRHGGALIGASNEINGLTLGGVGSGTVIENIEVVANQDDGIEWFGGTVSVKNALIWNSGDDAVDTDQSWFENLYFFNFPAPADTYNGVANAGRGDFGLDAATVPNFTGTTGPLVFNKLEATLKSGVTLTTAFRNGTDVYAAEVALKANTVGATKAAFVGWTWAEKAGQLADFK